jgi:hypothetical protein
MSENEWRIKNRIYFGWAIMILLFIQNLFFFGLLAITFYCGALKDFQWLLSAFFAGLMAETYFLDNHLLKRLFSEIN